METHIFGREENITISAGAEAVLRIRGLKGRIYIRGMKGFADAVRGEPLYRNGLEIVSGEFPLKPGDVLTIRDIKIEVWEEQIAIRGLSGSYRTDLPEKP